MTRPTPFTSAFATNADWFEMSDWPANAQEALAGMGDAWRGKKAIDKLQAQLGTKWKAQKKAAEKRQATAKKPAVPRRQLTEPAPLDEAKILASVESRYQHMEQLAPRLGATISGNVLNAFQAVSPSSPNAQQPPLRYFRALVWNLENFTADKRMKHTQAIDSARNAARIATVGSLACRLGADAALIMETGGDIGAVTTRLAKRWGDCEKGHQDCKPVHPLATSATHVMPELPWNVAARIYIAEPDTVNALRLLGEGYRIVPAVLPRVTPSLLAKTRELLLNTSNSFRLCPAFPPVLDTVDATLRGWIKWCIDLQKEHRLFEEEEDPIAAEYDDMEVIAEEEEDEDGFFDDEDDYSPGIDDDVDTDDDEEMGSEDGTNDGSESEDVDDISEEEEIPGRSELLMLVLDPREDGTAAIAPGTKDDVQALCNGIEQARELATLYGGYALESAVAHAAQLSLLLGLLQATGALEKAVSDNKMLWGNGDGSPADQVVMILLLAGGCEIALSAHDDQNGPLMTATDGELLLNACFRLKILDKPNSETYCIAYRPHAEVQENRFFNAMGQELGYHTDGLYGILRGASTGELLATQQPGNALAGRAGLLIRFPTVGEQWISFLLHHNRYTGNKATDKLRADHTKSENTVIARLRTIEDELTFLANHAPQTLLVGDFNLPYDYVHLSNKTGVPAMRRDRLIHYHRLKIAMAGYLRRRATDGTARRTTLRVPRNIAKGADILSETYDAVYQPFDFQLGAARVRSATVVRVGAFFDKDTLLQPLTYEGEQGTVNGQLRTVVCDSIASLYRGLVRFIANAIKDSVEWLDALAKKHGKNKRITGACAQLVSYAQDHTDDLRRRAAAFDKLLRAAGGSDAFYAAIIVDGTAQKATTTAELDVIKKAVANVKDHVVVPKNPRGQKRPPKPGPVRLLEVPELIGALTNLEADSDRRLWCAYHALVSDHLPLLVEIDLQG